MSPQRAGRNVGSAVVLGTQWGGLELSEEGGRGMAFQGRGEETHQIETNQILGQSHGLQTKWGKSLILRGWFDRG